MSSLQSAKGWGQTLLTLGLLFSSCTLLSGCGQLTLTPDHYDICVVVDHSGSTRSNPKFNDTLREISKVYLSILRTGSQNEVSLQHGGGLENEIVYEGKGRGLTELRDKLNALANGADDDHDADHHHDDHPAASKGHGKHIPVLVDAHGAEEGLANGTPVVETMLSPALAWINERPAHDQKMVIIVSDLIADATKYEDGTYKYYIDPAKFKWSVDNPQNVHLRFYMVNTDTSNHLREAWRSSGVDMRFFRPGYTVDKGDLFPRDTQ